SNAHAYPKRKIYRRIKGNMETQMEIRISVLHRLYGKNTGGWKMNLNEYQNLSKRTMPVIEDVTNPAEVGTVRVNYALGVAGESGEVADLVKKEAFHGHYTTVDEMKKELGDVLHYVSGLATLYGLRLEDVAQGNIDKLKKRYPSGF